jgi:alanine racemase
VTRFRPTVVEVDLDAIRYNVRAIAPPGVAVMAVVKGDAYGHGDVPVARAALEAGASWLGVALVEEGLALREAGIGAPVLVLSEFPLGAEKEALAAGLTPTVYSEDGVALVAEAAGAIGRTVGVHLKLDTGMHRLGLWPPVRAPELARQVAGAGLELQGLWTHFATAEADEPGTRRQLQALLDAARALGEAGFPPRLLHAANSAATILHPASHLELVRPGGAIYGLAAGPGLERGLRPALSWRSAVTMARRLPARERVSYGHRYELERDATVATVPVGYEDGYSRSLSGRADVLIRGRRCRVAGTVTMDQIMVDCGDLDVIAGDEAVLLGRQGDEQIAAEELAELAGTISYEIVTAISERVPREYRG